MPSHRALAMFRGRNEEHTSLSLNADPQFEEPPKRAVQQIIMDHLGLRLNNAQRKLAQRCSELDVAHQGVDASGNELMGTVRERAEDESNQRLCRNLHDLLIWRPCRTAQRWASIGSAYRGVKVAVVDATGKLVAPIPFIRIPGRPQKQR